MSSIKLTSTSVNFTESNGVTRVQTDSYPSIGTIICWAGQNVNLLNDKYLICDGTSKNKNTYPELFNVIGYRYGGSDPNFNLPDYTNKYAPGSQNVQNLDLDGESGASGGDSIMSNHHFPHSHSSVSVSTVKHNNNYSISTWSGGTWRVYDYNTQYWNRTTSNPQDPFNETTYNTQTTTLPPYTLFTFIIKAKK